MTLRSLEIFVKVAETGQMSLAAKQLYISQSSVSQAISDIEKEYNVLLFERIKKRLYLTSVGASLLEYAKQSISLQNTIDFWLKQYSNTKYIRVGATLTVGCSIMGSLITQLTEQIPDVKPFVYVDNTQVIEERLLNNTIDIALVEGTIKNKAISTEFAMDDDMVMICGKDSKFFGRDEVSLEEFSKENFVLREHGSGTRDLLEKVLKQNEIEYNITWECHSAENIKKAVIENYGISCISERLVHYECQRQVLWAFTIKGLSLKRRFTIATLQGKAINDTIKTFKQIIYDYAMKERANRHFNIQTHLIDY